MNTTCLLCGEEVTETFPASIASFEHGEFVERVVHQECMLRSVTGGIGHHENHAYWCVQMHDPDGGRTYRQSALEVDKLIRAQQASRYN